MSARLAAGIWVAAHIRRCEIEGAAAFVARKGAEESGAVLLKIATLDGQARALTRATLGDGGSGWTWLVGPDPAPEPEVDQRLSRQAEFDPDVWVLEIEDRQGRHFLDDLIG
ncbi:MAG: DUF1491 family protein [Pseudomonadota bacterium]